MIDPVFDISNDYANNDKMMCVSESEKEGNILNPFLLFFFPEFEMSLWLPFPLFIFLELKMLWFIFQFQTVFA